MVWARCVSCGETFTSRDASLAVVTEAELAEEVEKVRRGEKVTFAKRGVEAAQAAYDGFRLAHGKHEGYAEEEALRT